MTSETVFFLYWSVMISIGMHFVKTVEMNTRGMYRLTKKDNIDRVALMDES